MRANVRIAALFICRPGLQVCGLRRYAFAILCDSLFAQTMDEGCNPHCDARVAQTGPVVP